MGNIGTPELFVVLIVALLVLGPQRLPQAARQIGKAMSEFRRVTGGLQAEVRDAMSTIEREIKGEDAGTPPPSYVIEPSPNVPPPPAPAPPPSPAPPTDGDPAPEA